MSATKKPISFLRCNMETCCLKTLCRLEAKNCAYCGRLIRRSQQQKEDLFFEIAQYFEDEKEAIQCIEDLDLYGEVVVARYGLAVKRECIMGSQ